MVDKNREGNKRIQNLRKHDEEEEHVHAIGNHKAVISTASKKLSRSKSIDCIQEQIRAEHELDPKKPE